MKRATTCGSGLLCTLSLVACAADLTTADDGEGLSLEGVRTVAIGGGSWATVVDAREQGSYRFFDLDGAAEVDAHDPSWDLAFSRYRVQSNGGDNGEGGVIVAKLDDVDFAELVQAPSVGYVQDSAMVEEGSASGDPNYAFLGADPWYTYDEASHGLMPLARVYVIRSTDESFFKVQMVAYYDDVGTSGFPAFHWAMIKAPVGAVMAELQALSRGMGD